MTRSQKAQKGEQSESLNNSVSFFQELLKGFCTLVNTTHDISYCPNSNKQCEHEKHI